MKRGALIGFGLAGSVFHAPLIAATAGLELGTIVTSNSERARRAKAEHAGSAIEASVDAVWAGDHDFVVIAAITSAHVPLAERAIEAGMAVVVDKPLAPSAAAARRLIELAEAASVPLTVFHNRRWDSDFLTLGALLEAGRLGRVHRFESRFERFVPDPPAGAWRFDASREHGGGVLLDLGTHLVDQALHLFGPAEEVSGSARSLRGGAGDDDAFVCIRHATGVESLLWASELTASPGPRLRVLGSAGAFVAEAIDSQEDALRAGDRPGEEWGREREERWGRLMSAGGSEPVPSEHGAWPEFYRLFELSLRSEGDLPVDPGDAVRVLEVLEQVHSL